MALAMRVIRYEALEAMIASLRTEAETRETSLTDALAALAATRTELDTSQTSLSEALTRLGTANSALAGARSNLGDTEGQLAVARDELAQLLLGGVAHLFLAVGLIAL